MKVLVLYDSLYGNTKRIAECIAASVPGGEARLACVSEAKQSDLLGLDLLIFGSPTHGGRAKPSAQEFLDQISSGALAGTAVAAFDTRFAAGDQKLPLRLLMRFIGYASPKILSLLESKGGQRIAGPEGFVVLGKEGALKDDEEKKATLWAESILNALASRQ